MAVSSDGKSNRLLIGLSQVRVLHGQQLTNHVLAEYLTALRGAVCFQKMYVCVSSDTGGRFGGRPPCTHGLVVGQRSPKP